MLASGHVAASAPLAAAIYLASGSWAAAFLGVASSVFVDVDHVADYLFWKKWKFTATGFFRDYNAEIVPTLVFVLHSWELLALAGFLLWLWPSWPAGALWLGWLYHLAWDQATNKVGWNFYFFSYRALRRFARRSLCVRPKA